MHEKRGRDRRGGKGKGGKRGKELYSKLYV